MPKIIRPMDLFKDSRAFDWPDMPGSSNASFGHVPAWLGRGGAPSVGQTVLYNPEDGTSGAARRGGGGGGGSGSSTGGGSGGTTTTPAPSQTGTPGGLTINVTWDASVAAAPTAFTDGVMAAVHYMESLFSDPVTVAINVGYGEVNGTALASNALGASQSYLTSYSYATLAGAVAADATTADDASAAASLPATNPAPGTLWTTTAQAKALGLASGTGTDGFVGFSSTMAFDYDITDGVPNGYYDFNGVVLHEISEVMGRIMLTGANIAGNANSMDLFDLFHYSAAGVRTFSATTPGYLSFDGGVTNVGTFNSAGGGDAGDWASRMGDDAFNAFSYFGTVNTVSTADIRAMDGIGWDRVMPSTPTGVAATAAAGSLAAAEGYSGLTAGAALAGIVQVGGLATHGYAYTLGGSDAGAFTLTGSGNAATLAAAPGGAAGAAGGRLYALTVTAADTTSGTTGPASPLNVIVGGSSGDTIGVAGLTGNAAAPAFIYGLGGNDRIDASGMTGPTWIAGGAGADTMTGGSGADTFMFASTSESSRTAMDIITNFQAGTDLINLAGLGGALNVVGQIGSSRLGAHSVGWQTSGGNTFVYVNASGGSEKLTGIDMKIELLGNISLSDSSFVTV